MEHPVLYIKFQIDRQNVLKGLTWGNLISLFFHQKFVSKCSKLTSFWMSCSRQRRIGAGVPNRFQRWVSLLSLPFGCSQLSQYTWLGHPVHYCRNTLWVTTTIKKELYYFVFIYPLKNNKQWYKKYITLFKVFNTNLSLPSFWGRRKIHLLNTKNERRINLRVVSI